MGFLNRVILKKNQELKLVLIMLVLILIVMIGDSYNFFVL